MEKMTIHRALSELKLIDAKIEKRIRAIKPSGAMQTGKPVNGFYTESEFANEAKSKYQSVVDLIERKRLIKSAIVDANAKTIVNVNGKEMTIADAINFKNFIDLKKKLIAELSVKHQSMKSEVNRFNDTVQNNALKLAEAALQKDNVKIGDNDAVAITEPYIEKNKHYLVDPLKVEELVEELQSEVDGFESEVDAVLSEINAITIIEI